MSPNFEDEYAKRKRKAREEEEDEAKYSCAYPKFNPFLALPSLDTTKGKPSADDVARAKRLAHKELLTLKANGLAEAEWSTKQSLVNQAADCIIQLPWSELRYRWLMYVFSSLHVQFVLILEYIGQSLHALRTLHPDQDRLNSLPQAPAPPEGVPRNLISLRIKKNGPLMSMRVEIRYGELGL
jgi:hypothetical protein